MAAPRGRVGKEQEARQEMKEERVIRRVTKIGGRKGGLSLGACLTRALAEPSAAISTTH